MYGILLLQGGNRMKKTIEEVRDYLLENRVDEHGDLNLMGLDFSDFGGDVHISRMNVQGDLFQSVHKVQGDLYQSSHNVQGDLAQSYHKVQGDLFQSYHNVQGDLYQNEHEIQGNYYSKGIEVKGDIEFDEPVQLLKKITLDELKEMGYELVEEY